MNWKSPPADPSKKWLNKSLELLITLVCNWSCVSCNAFSQFSSFGFVKKGTMTLAQISHFCDEMERDNAYFGRIRILGGEPTLHPQFHAIVTMLYERLVAKGHVGHLEIITNGTHMDRIRPIQHMIAKVKPSGERAKDKHHVANLIHTPKSLGYKGQRCGQPEFCGWTLSAYGFSACSSAAGIQRLRDMMGPEHQKLELPQVRGTNANWPHLQDMCDLCFCGLKPEHKIRSGTRDPSRNQPGPDVVDDVNAWAGGKQPDWPRYGGVADGAELPQVPTTV